MYEFEISAEKAREFALECFDDIAQAFQRANSREEDKNLVDSEQ